MLATGQYHDILNVLSSRLEGEQAKLPWLGTAASDMMRQMATVSAVMQLNAEMLNGKAKPR